MSAYGRDIEEAERDLENGRISTLRELIAERDRIREREDRPPPDDRVGRDER